MFCVIGVARFHDLIAILMVKVRVKMMVKVRVKMMVKVRVKMMIKVRVKILIWNSSGDTNI